MARLSGTARIAEKRLKRLQKLKPGTPTYNSYALFIKRLVKQPGVEEKLKAAGVSVPQDVRQARVRDTRTESSKRLKTKKEIARSIRKAAAVAENDPNISAANKRQIDQALKELEREELGEAVDRAKAESPGTDIVVPFGPDATAEDAQRAVDKTNLYREIRSAQAEGQVTTTTTPGKTYVVLDNRSVPLEAYEKAQAENRFIESLQSPVNRFLAKRTQEKAEARFIIQKAGELARSQPYTLGARDKNDNYAVVVQNKTDKLVRKLEEKEGALSTQAQARLIKYSSEGGVLNAPPGILLSPTQLKIVGGSVAAAGVGLAAEAIKSPGATAATVGGLGLLTLVPVVGPFLAGGVIIGGTAYTVSQEKTPAAKATKLIGEAGLLGAFVLGGEAISGTKAAGAARAGAKRYGAKLYTEGIRPTIESVKAAARGSAKKILSPVREKLKPIDTFLTSIESKYRETKVTLGGKEAVRGSKQEPLSFFVRRVTEEKPKPPERKPRYYFEDEGLKAERPYSPPKQRTIYKRIARVEPASEEGALKTFRKVVVENKNIFRGEAKPGKPTDIITVRYVPDKVTRKAPKGLTKEQRAARAEQIRIERENRLRRERRAERAADDLYLQLSRKQKRELSRVPKEEDVYKIAGAFFEFAEGKRITLEETYTGPSRFGARRAKEQRARDLFKLDEKIAAFKSELKTAAPVYKKSPFSKPKERTLFKQLARADKASEEGIAATFREVLVENKDIFAGRGRPSGKTTERIQVTFVREKPRKPPRGLTKEQLSARAKKIKEDRRIQRENRLRREQRFIVKDTDTIIRTPKDTPSNKLKRSRKSIREELIPTSSKDTARSFRILFEDKPPQKTISQSTLRNKAALARRQAAREKRPYILEGERGELVKIEATPKEYGRIVRKREGLRVRQSVGPLSTLEGFFRVPDISPPKKPVKQLLGVRFRTPQPTRTAAKRQAKGLRDLNPRGFPEPGKKEAGDFVTVEQEGGTVTILERPATAPASLEAAPTRAPTILKGQSPKGTQVILTKGFTRASREGSLILGEAIEGRPETRQSKALQEIPLLNSKARLGSDVLYVQGQRPGQETRQELRQEAVTRQVTEQAQRLELRQASRLRQRQRLKYPERFVPPLDVPEDEDEEKKKREEFLLSVRRRGKFRPVGTFSSLKEAGRAGVSIVGATAAASFKITERGGKIATGRLKLPSASYIASKREAGVAVQRRERRISTRAEYRDITKGLLLKKRRR